MQWRPNKDVTLQDVWLDKAEVCLSLDLHQSARQLLAEALMVSVVSPEERKQFAVENMAPTKTIFTCRCVQELREKNSQSRSLLLLAHLACEEQNFSEALDLLDGAQALGGSSEFWFQLTLLRVTAAVGQRRPDSQAEVTKSTWIQAA